MFCHPPTSTFLSFLIPCQHFLFTPSQHLSCCDHQRQQAPSAPYQLHGLDSYLEIPPPHRLLFHCHDWPQLHLTPQQFGQLQPALRISKPSSVKLHMLVSSWLYHGHPKPLRDCHNPENLLHLLGISEMCPLHTRTPFNISLWYSIM